MVKQMLRPVSWEKEEELVCVWLSLVITAKSLVLTNEGGGLEGPHSLNQSLHMGHIMGKGNLFRQRPHQPHHTVSLQLGGKQRLMTHDTANTDAVCARLAARQQCACLPCSRVDIHFNSGPSACHGTQALSGPVWLCLRHVALKGRKHHS